jgi:hypothetical protein
MKRIIRLTESDLTRIVKQVIEEQWWLAFAEAAVSEGPGMGWGPDIGNLDTDLKNARKQSEVQNLINKVAVEKQKIIKSKNDLNIKCSPYTKIKKPGTNAGEIQDFLIALGHNISKDWAFGNGTATALGTYFYGTKKGIRSVDDLWNQMKRDGLDVGTTSGFGPKMATAISSKISGIVDKIKSNCNAQITKLNGGLNILKTKEDKLDKKMREVSPKLYS